MNIQIFGSSKCFDTKKAERWFKERRIKYQYIDLFKKGFSPGEYRSVRAYITRDAAEEKLFENPQLFNTPIVRNGREVTVGYHPEIWETWE